MVNKSSTYIIIVTYNGMRWLERTLASIPKNYPVIIVDNASIDNTCEYIKANYPGIKLIQEKTNLGFGQANNKGISLALSQEADAVFLLNQDAYLEEDSLSKLESFYQSYPDYGILSPVHYNGNGDKLDRYFSKYMSYDKSPEFYGDALANRLKKVYDIRFVNAAGWFLPKKTLETIGGFDPIFFHYGEDDNYVQRVHFHLFKIGVIPTSILYHDREDRKKEKPKAFSKDYFKTVEKMYKVRLADIRLKDFSQETKRESTVLKQNALKSIIKLNFSRAKGYLKERSLLKNWVLEIEKSRQRNSTKGAHYL